jgi:hypothetical protein
MLIESALAIQPCSREFRPGSRRWVWALHFHKICREHHCARSSARFFGRGGHRIVARASVPRYDPLTQMGIRQMFTEGGDGEGPKDIVLIAYPDGTMLCDPE